jgi:cell division protease FtsH
MIFSSVLVNATFWALEHGIGHATMAMSSDCKHVVVTAGIKTANFAVDLELNLKKARTTLDTKTLVAVHETGHAYVHAILTNSAPLEIKVNPASFEGGYMLPNENRTIMTKQNLLDDIAVYLAGTVAEEVYFGSENRSSGAGNDLDRATEIASDLVRRYGLGSTLARIDAAGPGGVTHVTNLDESNCDIEIILKQEYQRAKDILVAGKQHIATIVNALLKDNTIDQETFIKLMSGTMSLTAEAVEYPFHQKWIDQTGN